MVQRAAIKERLEAFIVEQVGSEELSAIESNAPVDQYLNSLGFVALLAFIEELRGFPITDEELDLEKLTSLDTIVQSFF
jgi:acyl carrier protein